MKTLSPYTLFSSSFSFIQFGPVIIHTGIYFKISRVGKSFMYLNIYFNVNIVKNESHSKYPKIECDEFWFTSDNDWRMIYLALYLYSSTSLLLPLEENVRYYLTCLSTYCDNQKYPLYFQNIALMIMLLSIEIICVGHCGMMGFFEFLYPPWDFLTSTVE